MSRTYFPTYSLNRFGVRVTNQRATLGADVARFPAEPAPRAAMTPTRPILGAVTPTSEMIRVGTFWDGYPIPGPMPVYPGPISNLPTAPANPPTFNPPPSATGGGGAAPSAGGATTSVSTQVLPTPTVATPPPAQIVPVLVSSGGGVSTPSTPTVTAPAASTGGLVEGIAAWLSGKTMIFSYAVPNALLAGVVVLGFAWLSSSGKKR